MRARATSSGLPALTRTRCRDSRFSRRTGPRSSRASTSCGPCAALIRAFRAECTWCWGTGGRSSACTPPCLAHEWRGEGDADHLECEGGEGEGPSDHAGSRAVGSRGEQEGQHAADQGPAPERQEGARGGEGNRVALDGRERALPELDRAEGAAAHADVTAFDRSER